MQRRLETQGLQQNLQLELKQEASLGSVKALTIWPRLSCDMGGNMHYPMFRDLNVNRVLKVTSWKQ